MAQGGPRGYPLGFEPSVDGVSLPGIRELRKELKKLEDSRPWLKELSAANRAVARDVAGWSQAAAASMGGQQAHFAGALAGRATQTAARVEVAGARTPKGKARANPAFWGTKAQGNWIGVSWDVGVSGQGPYAINDTIARRYVEIKARFRRIVDDLTRQAFPDGGP